MTSSHGYKTKALGITVGVLVSCIFTVLVSMPWLCCCVIVLHDVATRENWVNTALAVCNFFLLPNFCCSVAKPCPTLCDPKGCSTPWPSPKVWSNSCPLSQWCHQIISSSIVPFSSHLQSLPNHALSVSQLFASGGQSIGALVSASFLPINIQGWFPLGWIGLITWFCCDIIDTYK